MSAASTTPEIAARSGRCAPRRPAIAPRRLAKAARRLAIAGSLLLGSACARAPSPEPMPSVQAGWLQEGDASWYGPGFHGRRTASGEVYDMEALTAAHPELPFGSRVRVVNLDNGRTTVVRVNDRGPFARGRVIDLSRAAARAIDMLDAGTARVRLEALDSVSEASAARGGPRVVPDGCSLVQVGAFAERRNAVEMVRRLEARGEPVRQVRGGDGLTRVLVGPYESEARVRMLLERYDGRVRPCD